MPRFKEVKSLFQLGINRVTENIDYWCMYPSTETDAVDRKITENPFEELPLIILEKLIYSIGKELQQDKRYAEILLTKQIRFLGLWHGISSELIDYIFNIISIKCTELKFIHLGWCDIENIPKFDKVQVLHMPHNPFGDDCLKTVGTYCTDLRVLDISSCRNVTDIGIEWLCVSVDCKKESSRSGQCKLIEKLEIFYTLITRNGVLTAIENLAFLKFLHHEDTLNVYAEIAQKALDRNILPFPSFSLTSLSNIVDTTIPYKPGSIRLVVSICPLITEVNIVAVNGLADSDLQGLLALKSLVELALICELETDFPFQDSITFDGGVISLLESFGTSLKMLELEGIQGVNVGLIAEHCSNLLDLRLRGNFAYSTSASLEWENPIPLKMMKMEQPRLLKLEKICFVRYPFEEIEVDHDLFIVPFEALWLLLSSPLLKRCSVRGCDWLSDGILLDAENVHHFLNLESFRISDCHRVSKNGIELLLKDSIPLREIEVDNCRLIEQEIIDDWKMKAAHNNWELSISFKPWKPDEDVLENDDNDEQ